MNQNAPRKQQLVSEGSAYRNRLGTARREVRDGIRPEALAAGAVSVAGDVARGLLGGAGVGGIGLQTLLPLAVSSGRLLINKSAGKPVLRGVLLAAVAAAAVFVIRRRASQDE